MPEVGGVVHTHSTYATAWAARGEAIPCVITAMADEFGGEIPLGPFALIGSDEIGRGIVSTLAGHRSPAVLMRSHGVFTIGATARDAVTPCSCSYYHLPVLLVAMRNSRLVLAGTVLEIVPLLGFLLLAAFWLYTLNGHVARRNSNLTGSTKLSCATPSRSETQKREWEADLAAKQARAQRHFEQKMHAWQAAVSAIQARVKDSTGNGKKN